MQATSADSSRRSRAPWLALTLAVGAAGLAVVQTSPAAQALLQFDRAAIAAGQLWRIVTGSLVHYGWAHLAADFGPLAGLLWIGRRRLRTLLIVAAAAAPAIGLGVYLCAGGITVYRGLSGVDLAVLVYLLVIFARRDGGWKAAGWAALLLATAGRAAYEAATGRPLLPMSLPDGVAVVGIAHIAGLAVGVAAALAAKPGRADPPPAHDAEAEQVAQGPT